MFEDYERFKKDVYLLTKIDLNYYKEKQMRRRINAIATKNGCDDYPEYTRMSISLQSMYRSSIAIRISGSFLTKRLFQNS